MTRRGRILRDTNNGPGLLAVDGRQYSFTLEDMWLSDVPPRPGMIVDVAFDSQDAPRSVQAVPDNQIAKEQADQALAGARRQGTAIASNLKAKFGVPFIVAFVLLVLGWFFLAAVRVGPSEMSVSVTFWQVLGYVGDIKAVQALGQNPNFSPGSGIWGLLAIAALAGPLVPYFRKERYGALGGVLPLAMMVLVGVLLDTGLHSALAKNFGTSPMGVRAANEAITRFMEGIHFGIGLWIALGAGIYFAYMGVKRFLIASA